VQPLNELSPDQKIAALNERVEELRGRLGWNPKQLGEIHALYAQHVEAGQPFPLDLEEHSLWLILQFVRPDDAKAAARLADVLRLQGKAVPGKLGGTNGSGGTKPSSGPAARPAPTPAPNFDVYHQLPPHVLYTYRDKQAIVNDALKAYTAVPVEDEPSGLSTDPIRIINFFQLIEAANRLPPGDYLELGSHRGFSTRVIHRFMDPDMTLYAFDTFEGFDSRDIEIEKQKYASQWEAGNFAPTSVERVARYVGDGEWPANLKLVKGWFPESFKGHEHIRWRFVHIDFDLYQPIKTGLETVWGPLLPGGVVVVHDYGCYGFPAARKAVDEFCQSVGQPPIELSDRWSSAAIRKPFSAMER
jgi:hypothetical protein